MYLSIIYLLSICLSVCLSVYLAIYLSICLSVSVSVSVSVSRCLIMNLSIYWSIYQSLSDRRQLWETSLQVEFGTSKTKQSCKTSWQNWSWQLQNEELLQDNFWHWQRQKRCNSGRLCRADGVVPMRIVIFLTHLSKALRLPRKSEDKSYEVLHLSCKIILVNLPVRWSKMLMKYVSCTAPAIRHASLQTHFKRLTHSHACHPFCNCHKALTFCSLLAS